MSNSIFTVYKLTNEITGKSYIGKTKFTAERRFRTHVSAFKSRQKHNKAMQHLYRSMAIHGTDCWKIETLYCCTDESHCFEMEKYFITDHDTYGASGYNESYGGEGPSGHKRSEELKQRLKDNAYTRTAEHRKNTSEFIKKRHADGLYVVTEEQRRKIGEAQLGEKNHMYGKTMPETQKQMYRDKFTGSGNPFYGKHHTPESIEKLLKNRDRSYKNENNPAAIAITVDGVLFKTKRLAMQHFEVGYNVIQRWLKEGKAQIVDKE